MTATLISTSVISFLIFACSPLTSGAQTRASHPDMETMIMSTIDDTYNFRFDRAIAGAEQMIRSHPDEPEGYLYECGVRWKMFEEGCAGPADSAFREIKKLVDRACELAGARVESEPNDVKDLFYYAGSLVYRARYESMNKDWFSVMSDGLKSRKLLEKAIGIDPKFYDAYSGIGAFNYYASSIPWYLKPLAFVLGVSGNEEEGIEQLRKAAELGTYSKTEAAEFLATVVYTNREDFAAAAEWMMKLHRQYPDNLDFTRSLCWDFYKMKDYAGLIPAADSGLAEYDVSNGCHRTNISYLRFMRGAAYWNLDTNYSAAVADFSRVIEIGEPAFLLPWSYYCRGAVYERMGNKDKASADFRMVIKLNGDSYTYREAKVALDSLRGK